MRLQVETSSARDEPGKGGKLIELLAFNQCPAWFASRCITTQRDVRFQVGYYACRTIQSLLGHTLEEEIKRLDETLLSPRRRSKNKPFIET